MARTPLRFSIRGFHASQSLLDPRQGGGLWFSTGSYKNELFRSNFVIRFLTRKVKLVNCRKVKLSNNVFLKAMERDKFAINLFKILQVMSCLFDKLLNLGFT